LHTEVVELRRKNSELELQIKTMQDEIDALTIVNEAFGDESDHQKKVIENLENKLKSVAEEGEAESETESEIGSESYVESEEVPKKNRRVQPKRKAKQVADDLEAEDARVFILFLFF
jgi:hypothetical protein